ncbi:unnamed protein product [Strongylus vulgaris]|uniref:G protein-coupled receptor n=1 Tax=Strongylus vulgaris TaxID=40348 RepID=A0A3P7J6J1_STRVU|nr:unnamed protein product [Strongylus vulgaris]
MNASLRLILFMAITDCVHAVANPQVFNFFIALPYTIYLTSQWAPAQLDLDPYYVMISTTPFVVQLKVNLTLTIAIAVERNLMSTFWGKCISSFVYSLQQFPFCHFKGRHICTLSRLLNRKRSSQSSSKLNLFRNNFLIQALFTPMLYYKMSAAKYAVCSVLLGVSIGTCDLILLFFLSPVRRNPGCSAFGCFISYAFRRYWGMSNMVIKRTSFSIRREDTLDLDHEFHGNFLDFDDYCETAFYQKTAAIKNVFEQENQQIQTGKTKQSLFYTNFVPFIREIILGVSLFFVTIPSAIVGLVDMFDIPIFQIVGPFYIIGRLCAGSSNSIAYLLLNREMRELVKNLRRDGSFKRTATAMSTSKNHSNS